MAASSYHSPRREDAAAATRAAILDGARTLFLERGYADVTVPEIAKAARVAVQTVYASTGGKSAILAALLQPALEDPDGAATREAVQRIDDPRAVITAAAHGTRSVHERHWDILWGLLRHTPGELAAQQAIDTAVGHCLEGLTIIAHRLVDLDALRPGIGLPDAIDVLWFHFGQNAWFSLVGERGWNFDRAQTWLDESAARALLP
jgi:AcrR family transcriptional regulator